jgi:DNA segregation ATPase FtsK/SpoIIIE, S-DNA-T family
MPDLDAHEVFFRLAIDLVITQRRATTRLLQERLGIGYNTALLLISRLEGEGVIGPPDCDGLREVLVGQ